MANNTYPVLCGGTFFTLVLAAKREGTDKRSQYAGKLSELSQPELLAGLGRVVYPEYAPSGSKKVRSTNASAYRSCENDGTNLSFLYPQAVTAFDNRVKSEYVIALKAMCGFVSRFLEIGTSIAQEVWIVKCLLDLINSDQSIDDGQLFYIGETGQDITKAALRNKSDFCLQSFLLGVWHFIVVSRPDNKAGKATFDLWCPSSGNRTTREYEGNMGNGIQRIINVSILDAPSVDAVEQADNLAANEPTPVSQPELDNTSRKNNLLDLFEDALDEYDIAEFIDSDYTAMPLRMSLAIAVDTFVDAMRYHLRSFRRQQDEVFKNVISFVNAIEDYSGFLSMRMFSGDGNGKFSKWMWNNTIEDVEAARKYRRTINSLYGLISDGGTLSVFGYTSPDEDEKSQDGAGASSTEDWEISHEYYNLFVISDEIKNYRFTMQKDRSLRSDSDMVKKFGDLTPEAIAQIKTFPSLFMHENTNYGGQTSSDQEAYYGFVTGLRIQKNGVIKVYFRCEAKVNQQQINDIARLLDIYEGSGVMELNHTHWAIKNVDLIEELNEAGLLPKEDTTRALGGKANV